MVLLPIPDGLTSIKQYASPSGLLRTNVKTEVIDSLTNIASGSIFKNMDVKIPMLGTLLRETK